MFDIAKKRTMLLSEIGFEWHLARDLDEGRAKRSLTGTSSSLLDCAIKCLLVGFDEPAYKLLEKAREWLLAAIGEKEVPRGSTLAGIEPIRLEDLAICNWLHGKHDAASLARAIERRDANMAAEGQEKLSLELKLAVYLDAGRCDRAIELVETTRGLSPPKTIGQVRTQARMVYVLCKHRCKGEYSEEEVRACLRRFLRSHVDEWLKGPYATLARWMKIAHWDGVDSRQSSRQALLHCFDYVEVAGPDAAS